jgi:DNA polymerase-3 subunit delta'
VSWTRIQGHERWVKVFTRVAQQNRLAHAYLFVGPQGIGKHLFALELAKTLLCEGRGERFEACDQCESCVLVEAGTHPDYFAVALPEESNELPIELLRELCRNFSLKSARGKGKVGILDDADDLNEESANCFLKTLEEPPPGSVFILLGTSSEQQMPTILSRCQVVRFAPLPEKTVQQLLQQQGVEPALLSRIAHMAGGSPGQALALVDPGLWQFRKTLLEGLTRAPMDPMALGKTWGQFTEEAGKESAAQRRRAGLVLRLLLEFLTEALNLSLGGRPRTHEPEDRGMLHKMVERAGPEKILALLDRALQAETHLGRYVQVALVLEALLDSFAQTLDPKVPARTGSSA